MEPEQKLQTAKQIAGHMPLMDQMIQEINNITKNVINYTCISEKSFSYMHTTTYFKQFIISQLQLEAIKVQCTGFESDLTLDEATAKQTDFRQKISTLRARVKAAQNKLNAHTKKLQTKAEIKNKLKEEYLNVQKKVI